MPQLKPWSERYNDLDAELTLVWLGVHEPAAAGRVDWLEPADFGDQINAGIWSAFLSTRRARATLDMERVLDELVRADPDTGRTTLRESVGKALSIAAGTAREAEWSAWRVRAAALSRRLLAGLEEATAKVIAGEITDARSL